MPELDRSQLMIILQSEARDTMHAVLGMLHVMSEGLLTSDQRQCVLACRARADKLLRRMDDSRRLLQPEDDPPVRAPFDLAEVVEEVIGLMNVLALRKGVALETSASEKVPRTVISDRLLLEEILSRVLENGIGRSRVGRVIFHVEAESSDWAGLSTVRFRVTTQTPWEDRPMHHVPDAARKDNLDCALLRELVAGLGGTMIYEPSPREGIRITIALPLEVPAEPPGPAGSSRRILVAGNSAGTLLEDYLRGQPYQVSRASDGAQAVELAERNIYDAVVMDIRMPVLDGFAATRAIREWETRNGRPRTPIIVLSGEHQETQLREGGAAGCSAYLTRPVAKEAFLEMLREYPGAEANG
ncbi:MAG: response regulator [Bryobacterales bacterium]|nr:response regulator [Bryobacterales bacterium]